MKTKFSLVLATLSLFAATAFAQTQYIPIPASSVNGARAVVAITMPVIPPSLTTRDVTALIASNAPSAPSGSTCGWVVIHQDGSLSPSLPCNGQMIPMGNVYQCASGQFQSGIPDRPCYSQEWVESCGEGCTWAAVTTYHPAIGSTIGAVDSNRAVTFWNCPAAWAFTYLSNPDGKWQYTCMKS